MNKLVEVLAKKAMRSVFAASIVLSVAPRLNSSQTDLSLRIEQEQSPLPNPIPVNNSGVLPISREDVMPWFLAKRRSNSNLGKGMKPYALTHHYNRRIGTQNFRLSAGLTSNT